MKSIAVAVGTTRVLAVSADDTPRVVYIHHQSTNSIYLGGSDVTTSNGLHIQKDDTVAIELPSRQDIYAIASHAAQEIRVLTPDVD
jgi:hypothetical protein